VRVLKWEQDNTHGTIWTTSSLVESIDGQKLRYWVTRNFNNCMLNRQLFGCRY
jgi:hypothetical protein